MIQTARRLYVENIALTIAADCAMSALAHVIAPTWAHQHPNLIIWIATGITAVCLIWYRTRPNRTSPQPHA